MTARKFPESDVDMARKAIAFGILAPAFSETFRLFAEADRPAAEAALRRVEHFAVGLMQAFVDEAGDRVRPEMGEVARLVREATQQAGAEIAKLSN